MSAPYSHDLRKKAIEAIKQGERKIDVCRLLQISRNTLDLWLKREQETGDCRAITNFQRGCGHKITDWERFREFIQQHGGKTQAELARLWGDNVTQQNISDALKKMRVSRKKRLTGIENVLELKRQEFQEQLKTKLKSQIVYVDEALHR